MALNTPGPLAVSRLRDEGASVVKVEPPEGDPVRKLRPFKESANGALSIPVAHRNANKTSTVID